MDTFDQDWYLRRHPDVAQQVGLGHYASAADHYQTYGAAEGRFAAPRLPRFVIHIGPHKTGTTYLQRRLIGAQDYLQANHIAYPSAWLDPGGVSHRQLVRLLDAGREMEIAADIEQMVPRQDTVIVSSEDLCLLNLRSIDVLGRLLADYDVLVVFAVRPWPDRMLSLWKQTLFDGGTQNFPEFAARHLVDPRMSYVINDVAAIEGWCEVFGRSKVALISYPDLMAERLDIFDYFLEKFAGVPPTGQLPPESRAHESPDHIAAEVARSLNVLSQAKCVAPREGYYFLGHGADFSNDAINDILGRHTSSIHIDDTAALWDHLRYEMLSRFGDLLVGSSTRLRLKTARDLIYVSSDHFADMACRNEFERLWQGIHARTLAQPARELGAPLPSRTNAMNKPNAAWRSWWRSISRR